MRLPQHLTGRRKRYTPPTPSLLLFPPAQGPAHPPHPRAVPEGSGVAVQVGSPHGTPRLLSLLAPFFFAGSMRHFDQAAVFAEACLEYGLIKPNKETSILIWKNTQPRIQTLLPQISSLIFFFKVLRDEVWANKASIRGYTSVLCSCTCTVEPLYCGPLGNLVKCPL